jgi:spore coat protein U-like protein
MRNSGEGYRMRYILTAILAALFSFEGSDARAATATGSFSVTVTIASTCVVTSATTLNFGSQGVLATAVNQTSTITVTCTNTTPYNIGLNQGVNGSSVTTRQMKSSGGALVNYSLFSNAGMSTNWGQTVGTDTVAGTGNGSGQAYTVYGQIPAQTTPAPSTYTDTITVTVTY